MLTALLNKEVKYFCVPLWYPFVLFWVRPVIYIRYRVFSIVLVVWLSFCLSFRPLYRFLLLFVSVYYYYYYYYYCYLSSSKLPCVVFCLYICVFISFLHVLSSWLASGLLGLHVNKLIELNYYYHHHHHQVVLERLKKKIELLEVLDVDGRICMKNWS
jgi:hypothetical protein